MNQLELRNSDRRYYRDGYNKTKVLIDNKIYHKIIQDVVYGDNKYKD